MDARSRLRSITLVVFAVLLAVGCKQAEGEPCDVDDDCAGDLVCSCDLDLTVPRRGVCVTAGSPEECPESPDGGRPDGGERDGGVDAGSDAGTAEDAGTDAGSDAGSDAGTDAGSDAGTDAGSDAGSDAGTDAG